MDIDNQKTGIPSGTQPKSIPVLENKRRKYLLFIFIIVYIYFVLLSLLITDINTLEK